MQILPWSSGSTGRRYLSGYQLSQGFLCINVGDERLLEYSREIRAHWSDDVPPLADQLLWRIYMDLIERLDRLLEPIPEDLHWWMSSRPEKPEQRWYALCAMAWRRDSTIDCSLLADRICDALSGRLLPLDRLVAPPEISIWASETDVCVSWDNREKKVDDIPVWTAIRGTMQYQRAEFLAEMDDFRTRYFDAMERQLTCARQKVTDESIELELGSDEAHLREQRSIPLSKYLATAGQKSPVDWDEVRTALDTTMVLTGFRPN